MPSEPTTPPRHSGNLPANPLTPEQIRRTVRDQLFHCGEEHKLTKYRKKVAYGQKLFVRNMMLYKLLQLPPLPLALLKRGLTLR
jgi:hypothetical protein